ncbi:hypothetical protein C8F04DRAFT_1402931 [Mycena alexandri]|uniref:MYND-type domain-containing protein n=1 Tax=Mycena alexandri TaxID=1745969 RepID=A0AAD6S5X2_9AGAR|nr:hypothetical protein C8F04DRAFT_1402931 [Mycena alexandri]
MLPREEILRLLSSLGVDLPKKTKLHDAELDNRLSKALDGAQYLSRVVATLPFDPAVYPSWFRDKSNKPILEAIARHNVGEATLIDASERKGINDPFPLYTNAFMDLRQTLMSIGNACDKGMVPFVLQDKGEMSGICMRVLEVRKFDDHTPILMLVFQHDLKDNMSPGSFAWISSYVSSSSGSPLVAITATVQEQHLLLRILNNNKKRLSPSYKPKRAPTESSFSLSFLIPIGPLGAQDMAKFNANNGCSICGEPAKQKCSRCGAVRYCDAVCQKEDWKNHRPLCKAWQGAKWQGVKFILVDQHVPGLYSLRISRYDNVQHSDTRMRMECAKDNQGPPENTHGATPFIVKIQVNSSQALGPAHTIMRSDARHDGSNILIYDQRRTIDVMVLRAPEASEEENAPFDAVTALVREKGDRGIKTFCWAIRTGEWTLDICLDRLPEWQKW